MISCPVVDRTGFETWGLTTLTSTIVGLGGGGGGSFSFCACVLIMPPNNKATSMVGFFFIVINFCLDAVSVFFHTLILTGFNYFAASLFNLCGPFVKKNFVNFLAALQAISP